MTTTFTTPLPDDDPPAITDRGDTTLSIDRETTPTNNGHVRIQYRDTDAASWQETTVPYDQLTTTVTGLTAGADVEVRQRTETDHVTGEWTQAITHMQRTYEVTAEAATDYDRRTEKYREYTVTADAAASMTQVLRPVFPDEQALDVQWDFSAEHMGFASEWLDEDSIIDKTVRDGIGVTIGGSLTTTIEVFVEYDKNGDGTADVTSDVQELSEAYHTLAFDDSELFGEDGWYRVVVRGLRTYDTVNQLDIGAVHNNL